MRSSRRHPSAACSSAAFFADYHFPHEEVKIRCLCGHALCRLYLNCTFPRYRDWAEACD